jgi:hypothetical protein
MDAPLPATVKVREGSVSLQVRSSYMSVALELGRKYPWVPYQNGSNITDNPFLTEKNAHHRACRMSWA